MQINRIQGMGLYNAMYAATPASSGNPMKNGFASDALRFGAAVCNVHCNTTHRGEQKRDAHGVQNFVEVARKHDAYERGFQFYGKRRVSSD